MTPSELAADMARVLAGLQVARSINGGLVLGAALEPWDRLHQQLGGFGWKRPEDYERAIRQVLGMPADGAYSGLVHKAVPGDRDGYCGVCGQHIKQVPGGQGMTWVHTDSGAVAAPNPPGLREPS